MSLPNHVVVIPDGNRRWATKKKLPSFYGHKEGYERLRDIIRYTRDSGITYLTVWAFSTENWKRSNDEVSDLFKVITRGLSELHDTAKKEKTRVLHIGRRDRMSQELLHLMETVEEETKEYTGFCLCLAIDYGGEDEIKRAEKLFVSTQKENATITDFLDTTQRGIPNPDLIIRTGGEKRTSGFMPLQSVYAEWIFDEQLFPDFTVDKMEEALSEYSRRVRRFGE